VGVGLWFVDSVPDQRACRELLRKIRMVRSIKRLRSDTRPTSFEF
jgi:hypothetical protein